MLRVHCAAFIAALLAAGATSADEQARHSAVSGSEDDHRYMTKEWSWSEVTSVTTFTAYGPAEVVNALNPKDSPLECHGCLLASSVQFELEEADLLPEAAKSD